MSENVFVGNSKPVIPDSVSDFDISSINNGISQIESMKHEREMTGLFQCHDC